MHWNYRVCKKTYFSGTKQEEVGYTLREVYYDSDNRICAYSDDSVSPYAESRDELVRVLEKMQSALNKDVIDLDTLVIKSE